MCGGTHLVGWISKLLDGDSPTILYLCIGTLLNFLLLLIGNRNSIIFHKVQEEKVLVSSLRKGLQ
ncbi:hypothetical protein [Coxiella-like endosymbiont]|uniref:hypothetical protein n=1 Tax=Coxiella-like endosymbiont TaxID=1592897 RepID=UPI00272A45DB|nr:hypothetical protein [Coxiella-like endosymbiont]